MRTNRRTYRSVSGTGTNTWRHTTPSPSSVGSSAPVGIDASATTPVCSSHNRRAGSSSPDPATLASR